LTHDGVSENHVFFFYGHDEQKIVQLSEPKVCRLHQFFPQSRSRFSRFFRAVYSHSVQYVFLTMGDRKRRAAVCRVVAAVQLEEENQHEKGRRRLLERRDTTTVTSVYRPDMTRRT